jgi:hypothetical protein
MDEFEWPIVDLDPHLFFADMQQHTKERHLHLALFSFFKLCIRKLVSIFGIHQACV